MVATTYGNTQKITISLPAELIQQLNELVPARKRSKFIAEALQRQLEIEDFERILDETAGAWKEEDHPDLRTGADIDRAIREMRATWMVQGGGEDERLPD